MTEEEILSYVGSLPGVVTVTASAANGAPEVAWGDSFFSYDPERNLADDPRFLPFATLVTKDYDDFDTASALDRPGVFRLNIAVGKRLFEQLIGYPPAGHAGRHRDWDYTVTDTLLPHPAYATHAWVSILNPGDRTSEQARALLRSAHQRAVERHRVHR